ncbi:MAG TPA: DoxX family protein [Burkholderiales bacterium]|nr:DoxX family protein [Burkholderiales bacterium]
MQSASSTYAPTYRAAERNFALTDSVDLAARIALAAMFIWSGIDKLFLGTAGNVAYMQAYHVPLAGLLVYVAGLAELAGGLALAAGYQTRAAALVLGLFTLLVTPIFHNFWAVPADQALNQTIHFMKNLALVGGLLHVVAHGAGRFSLDSRKGSARG